MNKQDLINRNWKSIEKEEEPITHAYIDSQGYITAGPGIKLDSWKEFREFDFGGASEQEKQADYEALVRERDIMRREAKKGENPFQGRGAEGYYNIVKTEIPKEKMFELYSNKAGFIFDRWIDDVVKKNQKAGYLPKDFDFYMLPKDQQDAFFDMMYNMGPHKLSYFDANNRKAFPNFMNAVGQNDYEMMAKESHRPQIAKSRNQMVADKLRAAGEEVKWQRILSYLDI